MHKILQLSPFTSNNTASDVCSYIILIQNHEEKRGWIWVKSIQWIEFSSINVTTLRKKIGNKHRRRHFTTFWILISIQKIDVNCINERTLFLLYAQTPWRRDSLAILIKVLKWRKAYVKTNAILWHFNYFVHTCMQNLQTILVCQDVFGNSRMSQAGNKL